MFSVVRY